jgi:hypothetical protein
MFEGVNVFHKFPNITQSLWTNCKSYAERESKKGGPEHGMWKGTRVT